MKHINETDQFVRDFPKSSCTIRRIYPPIASYLILHLSSLYKKRHCKTSMRRNTRPTRFYPLLCASIKLLSPLLYLFSRVLTRRSVFPNFSGTSIALTREISGTSVVSIMQIRPAPAAKEETIYISRKYACHRDVNRALGQATMLQREEESKGDR